MKKFIQKTAADDNPPVEVETTVGGDRINLTVGVEDVVDIATWNDGERVGVAAHAELRIYPKRLAKALGIPSGMVSITNYDS